MKSKFFLALLMAALPCFAASDDGPNGTFSMTARFQADTGSRTMSFNLAVTHPMQRAEAASLRHFLEYGGQPALSSAIRDRSCGRLELGGRVYPINIIVVDPLPKGFHYIVVTTRPFKMDEVQQDSPSLEYPFTVVIFDVPEIGSGSGTLWRHAALKIDEQGIVQIDQYKDSPGTVTDIKRVN